MLKRYKLTKFWNGQWSIEENPEGEFVKWEDVESILNTRCGEEPSQEVST